MLATQQKVSAAFLTVTAVGALALTCRGLSEGPTGPGGGADPAEIKRLIGRLGSNRFAERAAASKRLEAMGEAALGPLRSAAASPDPEIRKRAEAILRAIQRRLYGERRRFDGHAPHWVVGVAIAPDGRKALTGGFDRMMRLWDVESGRELRRFEGHAGPVVAVAFAPDGRRALSGASDNTMRLWDADTGKELCRFEGHTGGVFVALFCPDERHALSGGKDGSVRLWRLPK